jgi:hypothetical protein
MRNLMIATLHQILANTNQGKRGDGADDTRQEKGVEDIASKT